jgi:hypothetical protein
MPETASIPSTAMRVTAHDLATSLSKVAKRSAAYAARRFNNFGDGVVSIDDIAADIVCQFAEVKGGLEFDNLNALYGFCCRVGLKSAAGYARQRGSPLFDTLESGEERETRGVSRYSIATSANSIENAVYARQVLRLISGMPRELRNTAMFMADGADLIEFAKESGLSLKEAMTAQKSLRSVLGRLMEDGRQERVEARDDERLAKEGC